MLDLLHGLLCRRWRHRCPSGRETSVTILRCAHLGDRQALLQRVVVRPENYDDRLEMDVALDGRQMRSRDAAPRLVTRVDDRQSPAVLRSDRRRTDPPRWRWLSARG